MANWLDKYEQGGLVLKKKTKDNYGKKANPNDVKASVGPDFVGLGYNTKGRDYSPAWGGQFQNGGYMQKAKSFPVINDVQKINEYGLKVPDWEAMTKQAKKIGAKQVRTKRGATIVFDDNWQVTGGTDPDPDLATLQMGGFLQPTSSKLPEGYVIPYNTPSTELAMSIGGEKGEPAYLIPSFKGGKKLKDPIAEYKKTGEHLGGPFKTWQEAEKFGEMRHKYVEKGQDIPTPLKTWGDMAMGGSMPGAVGFTYARVAGSAPANGKYTKKTKASAQNGKEMAFYQNGLDFKPKSISKNGSVIKDDMGQWAHPGEITEIGSNNITMQGVDYPVLGVSDTGDTQMMQPNQDYKFDGEKVTEYPMMQEGGWLDKYPEPMRQDATRNVIPRKMTDKERLEAVATSDQAQKKALNTAKEVIAERKKNKATKGDINTPGSWKIEEKARLFPSSVGGAGEMFDEYINPATYVGVLADALGESVAARDPKAVATSLALAAGTGAIGIDPLGSVIKGGKSAKAAGKYLTEETALKNAYKLNPLAFKANPEAYYRMLGTGEDVLESGLIRPNPNNIAPDGVQRFAVSHFSKGRPWNTRELGTAGYEGPYMAELSNYPMEGFTAAGWPKESLGHVPIDIPNVKLYKENWLKGYKEVPKPTSTSRQLTNEEIRAYNQKLYFDRRKGLGNQGPTEAPPEGLMPFESPEYKQGGWLNKYK